MNIPIIRFEVEGMKHTVMAALSQHAAQMDASMRAAVEEFCKPENIEAVISKTANLVIKSAIEAEISNFFSYGDGRRAIAEAVKARLLDKSTT